MNDLLTLCSEDGDTITVGLVDDGEPFESAAAGVIELAWGEHSDKAIAELWRDDLADQKAGGRVELTLGKSHILPPDESARLITWVEIVLAGLPAPPALGPRLRASALAV